MVMYPIMLKSQPQQSDVVHLFELVEGSTEGSGFEPISIWLRLPWAKDTMHMCMSCGAMLDIPDGSLEAHLKKYQAENGDKDAVVRIVYHHKGPRPSTPPTGISVATTADRTRVKSIREFIQMQESSDPGS